MFRFLPLLGLTSLVLSNILVPIVPVRGQESATFEDLQTEYEKLDLSNIDLTKDNDRNTDLDLILTEQTEYFKKNNTYLQKDEFNCLVGTCRVDIYKTPSGDQGYIILFFDNLLVSTISSGVENLTNDWELLTVPELKK